MNDFEPNWRSDGETLGKGGQAHTFLVYERAEPHRKGAAKRLTDLAREDRFRQEIEVYRRIDHPNVLKMLDEGVASKGRPYLVSEFCELGELTAAHLASLTTLERLLFFRAICDAIAEAHRRGIVHRDIKPDNILLKPGLVPVIADFGICFLIEREPGYQRMTEPYRVMASRHFGAPEAKDGRVDDVKPTADIYSLGKLLYWIMSGGNIFEREDHRTSRYALYEGDPSNSELELISRLLDQTITASPAQRIPSGPDLLMELDKLTDVIRAGGHAIGIHTPQKCLFCARGRYISIVNGVTEPAEAARLDANKLGFSVSEPYPRLLVMICDYCGNQQAFRPDLPAVRVGRPSDSKVQQERIARWDDATIRQQKR